MIRKNPCHDVDTPAGQIKTLGDYIVKVEEQEQLFDLLQREDQQPGLVHELMMALGDIKNGYLRGAEMRIIHVIEKLKEVK